jgi:excisionase family DNA binding protein
MVSTSSSPIAYTIAGSCQASGFSRSAIYRLIKQGELRAVKHGKRTLILERDLRHVLEKLPAVEAAAAA